MYLIFVESLHLFKLLSCFFLLLPFVLNRGQKWLLFFFNTILTSSIVYKLKRCCRFAV